MALWAGVWESWRWLENWRVLGFVSGPGLLIAVPGSRPLSGLQLSSFVLQGGLGELLRWHLPGFAPNTHVFCHSWSSQCLLL